jgi:hypothetical protein
MIARPLVRPLVRPAGRLSHTDVQTPIVFVITFNGYALTLNGYALTITR